MILSGQLQVEKDMDFITEIICSAEPENICPRSIVRVQRKDCICSNFLDLGVDEVSKEKCGGNN